MTEPPLDSRLVTNPAEPQLTSLEPSPELDARIRRLGHAALRAAHSSARMSPLESALSAVLVVCYAAYALSQIVFIFRRV